MKKVILILIMFFSVVSTSYANIPGMHTGEPNKSWKRY